MLVDDNTKMMTACENPIVKQTNDGCGVAQSGTKKKKAPNSVQALVLGIISLIISVSSVEYSFMGIIDSYSKDSADRISALIMIVFAVFSVVAALVLALIGRKKTNDGYRLYNDSPNSYFGVGMLKAGHITSLAGLILSVLAVALILLAIAIY